MRALHFLLEIDDLDGSGRERKRWGSQGDGEPAVQAAARKAVRHILAELPPAS